MAKPKFYADEPHVPANKIASNPNIQNASLGTEPPKMVPHNFPTVPLGGSHGYGHPKSARVGHSRLSGHPGAHNIGKKV